MKLLINPSAVCSYRTYRQVKYKALKVDIQRLHTINAGAQLTG